MKIETWIKYLDYTITLQTDSLTHLNFQRALLPLAHYDLVWIKYSKWLINSKNDLLGAKNVLLMGLKFSLKKTEIIKLLYSVICKLNEYVLLRNLLEKLSPHIPTMLKTLMILRYFGTIFSSKRSARILCIPVDILIHNQTGF